MSKEKYYFSKSLEKGLKILALFNRETPALSQSKISKTLGLNMTSTYRYTNTLVELGYLEKDVKTREIRPSIYCLLFCTNLIQATDHLRLIRELVDRIHRENNISIDVAFAVGDTLVRTYHREAEETLTYNLPDSSNNCLHNTALGKAYLAALPKDLALKKIEQMALIPKTEHTIVDANLLVKELEKTKKRRYAVSKEEYLPGLVAIGAPLFDPITGNPVGAVSFNFSTLQHTAGQIRKKYGGMIRDMATSLSERLPLEKNRR
jgi:DNA-binding IclR family transcriptional regulator